MSSSLKSGTTYESICGHCNGRLLIEPNAGAVACPHCGTTLTVPNDAALLAETPTLSPEEQPQTTGGKPSVFDSTVLRTAEAVAITVPSSVIKLPDFTRWGAGSSVVGAPTTGDASARQEVPPAAEPLQLQEISKPAEVKPAAPTARVPPAKRKPAGGSQASVAVSRGTFIAVMIYASAITAASVGLLFYVLTTPRRELESLPDVVPPQTEDGEISRVLAPIDAPLPPGHLLEIGQSQRFGDLLVTPLKVTREPLAFVHYREQEKRDPAGEVLKLWLKFENVSDSGRKFAPLDGELLFYRTFGGGGLKANTFLCPATQRTPDSLIAVYDHPVGSDWDLAEQKLGTVLAPGESVITYVPTESDLPSLAGPLAWRIHLRKGIANNGWGVTTLVEVNFDASEIGGA